MTLHRTADDLLTQLKGLISQLEKDHYSSPLSILNGSTLGQHIRHVLEFFQCLMHTKNELNYDLRNRDHAIENDPLVALQVIDALRQSLQEKQKNIPLTLTVDYSVEDPDISTMQSCFDRELAYNIEHTIHHMALLKIGIQNAFPTVALPEHFGVASSTVRYHQQLAAR